MNAPLIITDRAHRFHGGIHPPDNKAQSNRSSIVTLPLPPVLILPLRMHLGAPAEPRVSVGSTVRKGDILADAVGAISAAIHAPTSGRISAIEERVIAHESGLSAPCIILEADGEDAWRARQGYPDWRQRDAETLIQRLRDCGLAGLGGAGFPTEVKYRNTHQPIDTLIINAAECEPYITADDRLMRERAAEIVEGAAIAASLVGATTLRLGIEDNKPEALAAMTAAAQALGQSLRVTVVPTQYPSGGEKQLIQLITGQEVPAGGLPSDLGLICQNVGTLAAIRAAVVEDEPLIRRITTVTGAAVERPGNYEVLIGTPIETLLNVAGAHLKQADRVIMGGPMMGFALPDITAPVVKTTNCLLVPSKAELPASQLDNPCIRCGQCEQVCPAGLLPQQLFWAAKSRDLDSAELHSIGDCIECGACAWVCPSHIPLVHYYRYAKGEIRQERAEQIKAERARARFEARQARLEKEQQQKEARRAARSKAAAEAQARKQTEAGDTHSDPVQAALERARAKRAERAERQTGTADDNQPTQADLEKALALAAAKVKKANERLVAAEQQAPDTVPALQQAIGKLEQKHRQAQQALDAARNQDSSL